MIETTADTVQVCNREFWNEFGGAGQQSPHQAPDVSNAPDPHSENTSAVDEYLGMVEEEVQEVYSLEDESEVDNALETGGREGESRGYARSRKSNVRKLEGTSRVPRDESFQNWIPRTKSYRRVSQDFSLCCRGVTQDW